MKRWKLIILIFLVIFVSGCTNPETTGGIFSTSEIQIQDDISDISREVDLYSPQFEEKRLTYFPSVKKTPVIHSHYVTWVDERNGNDDIFIIDILTNEEKIIASSDFDEFNPIITESYVIYLREWGEWKPPLARDVMVYDIKNGETTRLTCDKYPKTLVYASDNFVVSNILDETYYFDISKGIRGCDPDRVIRIENLKSPEPRNMGDKWINPGEILEIEAGDSPLYKFWNAPNWTLYGGDDWRLVEDTQPPIQGIKVPCKKVLNVVNDLLICKDDERHVVSSYYFDGTMYKDIEWGYDYIDGNYALKDSYYYNWVQDEIPERNEFYEKCNENYNLNKAKFEGVLSRGKVLISGYNTIYVGDCNSYYPKSCQEYQSRVFKMFDFSDNSCIILLKTRYYELSPKRDPRYEIHANKDAEYFDGNNIVWIDNRNSECNSDFTLCNIVNEIYLGTINGE